MDWVCRRTQAGAGSATGALANVHAAPTARREERGKTACCLPARAPAAPPMASDSRFIDAIGFDGFLDVIDAEWAGERLPQEDVVVAASGDAPLVLDDGVFDELPALERERKELLWVDAGTDLLERPEEAEEGAAGEEELGEEEGGGRRGSGNA